MVTQYDWNICACLHRSRVWTKGLCSVRLSGLANLSGSYLLYVKEKPCPVHVFCTVIHKNTKPCVWMHLGDRSWPFQK